MEINKKFSLSIRVDSINPAHVRLSVFSGMILEEYEHENATRGKAGDLVLRCEEFLPFILQTNPHLVSYQEEVSLSDVKEYTGFDFK